MGEGVSGVSCRDWHTLILHKTSTYQVFYSFSEKACIMSVNSDKTWVTWGRFLSIFTTVCLHTNQCRRTSFYALHPGPCGEQCVEIEKKIILVASVETSCRKCFNRTTFWCFKPAHMHFCRRTTPRVSLQGVLLQYFLFWGLSELHDTLVQHWRMWVLH